MSKPSKHKTTPRRHRRSNAKAGALATNAVGAAKKPAGVVIAAFAPTVSSETERQATNASPVTSVNLQARLSDDATQGERLGEVGRAPAPAPDVAPARMDVVPVEALPVAVTEQRPIQETFEPAVAPSEGERPSALADVDLSPPREAEPAGADSGDPQVLSAPCEQPASAPSESAAPLPSQEQEEAAPETPRPEPHRADGPPAREAAKQVLAPMYVVHITPELAPIAKVGGLADVVFGLGREVEIRGNVVEYILPKYDCLRYDHIHGLERIYNDLWVPWAGGSIHCSVFQGWVYGRRCFFIEPHSRENFFNRGVFYGAPDDLARFAFFSRAAMEYLFKAGKHPEIIHCHDWPTGLVPVFLYEIYKHLGMRHSRVCYTIHNFAHQGVVAESILQATGLNRPEYYLHPDRLLHPSHRGVNMMKAGIVYSNFVTTVSPRHAWEAKHGQGFGLESSLHVHHAKFGGIVNGVDYDVWNPEVDRYLPQRYGESTLARKYEVKRALRNRLWLADNEKPVVAYIGRLDPQKGLDLVRHALWYCLNNRAQFVLLGSAPDPAVNASFWNLKRQVNDSPDCHIELAFNEELSHLIYAGADMVIVPSQFEPCGLTQLIALRYGTVPIVREVGGLADTVIDKDYTAAPLERRNGYVFRDYNAAGLESELGRALACYYHFPEHFRHLMVNAMRTDYSWAQPGEHYLNVYEHIRDK